MLAVAKAAFYFGLAYSVYVQARKNGTWSWPIFGRVMLFVAVLFGSLIVIGLGASNGRFGDPDPSVTGLLLLLLIGAVTLLATLVWRRRSRRAVSDEQFAEQ